MSRSLSFDCASTCCWHRCANASATRKAFDSEDGFPRFLAGKGASLEAFKAKAARPNCSMVYRRVDTAMRFVRRLDECAAVLEAELARAGA